ncbi:hypothetical protein C8R45DRAFT_836803 [Mycena sanguinolenta]|nr:hypothetical protein C8R45DRAFT_836803 [Mycena sanguinolenta]
MSTTTSRAVSENDEKPERSRNAKAQARHRAKRKAYIEELEETVTKLQSALGQFNLEHTMTVLPPPLAKIRELEQENARLLKQNDDLQRLLADSGHPGYARRAPCSTTGGGSNKRRKMDGGDEYVVSFFSFPCSSFARVSSRVLSTWFRAQ